MRLPALLPAHARCGAQRRGPNLYVNCHFDMKKEQGQAAGGLGEGRIWCTRGCSSLNMRSLTGTKRGQCAKLVGAAAPGLVYI